jgi:hypothetical protein
VRGYFLILYLDPLKKTTFFYCAGLGVKNCNEEIPNRPVLKKNNCFIS